MSIEIKFLEKCSIPSDINEHLPTLKKYAEECDIIVEFGVRDVVSTWALLAGKPKEMISVDSSNCNLSDASKLALEEGIKFTFIQEDSRIIDLPNHIDLLFIDTWHVYEQLKLELNRHSNKVSKFIIMHDTTTFGINGETPGHIGLTPAINEFLISDIGSQWSVLEEYTNCNGLTILKRNYE